MNQQAEGSQNGSNDLPGDIPEGKQGDQNVIVEKGELSAEQMAEVESGRYYSTKKLADTLGYSHAWISALLQQGRIKGIKPLGGQWRIPESEYKRLTTEGVPPLPREPLKRQVTEIPVSPELQDKVAPDKERKAKEAEPGEKPLPWHGLDFSGLFGGKKE